MGNKEIRFEVAYKELEEILAKMSNSDVTVEESVALYAKAADLIANCHEALAKAQVQVEEIDKKLLQMEDEP